MTNTHDESDEDALRLLRRAREWLRGLNQVEYEKPCGCVEIVDKKPILPMDEPGCQVVEKGIRTTGTKEYTNATVYSREFWARLSCNECGAVYERTRSAGRKTAYGEPNPDATHELEVDHRPGPLGGSYIHKDIPVVISDD